MTRSLGTMSALDEHRRHTDGRIQRARVLVIEEHALMAAGLRLVLAGRRWDVETVEDYTAERVAAHAERFQPHGAILSIRVGRGVDAGIALIETLVASGTPVLVLSAERRRLVLGRFLEAGAAGWIGRDEALDQVDSALARLVAGKPILGKTIRATLLDELRREREKERRARSIFAELTQREALVLAALTDGLTADEIAREHVVALCTVRSQIRAVLQKLDVRSQLAAVALASSHRDLLPHRGGPMPDRRQPAPRTPATQDLVSTIA